MIEQILAFGLIAAAQQARFEVGPNIQVSSARAQEPHNEVVIAADPGDARRLIACSMIRRADASMTSAAYVSFDGGASWTAPVVSNASYANDPTCAYGAHGTVYFAHKAKLDPPAPYWSSDSDRLVVHRSRDGGRTWDAPLRGPQTTDRPWIAVDLVAAAPWHRLMVAYNAHVHAAGANRHENESFRNAVALQLSNDGGVSFGTPALYALPQQSAQSGHNAAMSDLVISSTGSPFVLYTHQVVGGRNASTGKLTELSASLHVLRFSEGGALEPTARVAELKSGYNSPHTRGVPARMAIDPMSTRFKDRLYVVWADYGRGRGQIMLSSSSDEGRTWTAPRIVNDDSARAHPIGGPDPFMPTVAVNRNGVVGVLWYDRRDHPDNQSFHVRFAASTDGGASFSSSVRVSSAPNQVPREATPGFLVTGGDTAGLTAAADGRFHTLWIDNRTGTQQVWTAAITLVR